MHSCHEMREQAVTFHRNAFTDCSRKETQRSQYFQRTKSSLLPITPHLPFKGDPGGNTKAVICWITTASSAALLKVLGYLPLHWATSSWQSRCDPPVVLRPCSSKPEEPWQWTRVPLCLGCSFQRKPENKSCVVATHSGLKKCGARRQTGAVPLGKDYHTQCGCTCSALCTATLHFKFIWQFLHRKTLKILLLSPQEKKHCVNKEPSRYKQYRWPHSKPCSWILHIPGVIQNI